MALIPNLYRPTEGRVIAGVCAGVARSLNMDVKIVRIIMLLAVLVGGVSVWAYPLLWLLMADEGQPKSPAEELFTQAKEWNDNRNQPGVSTQPSAAEPQPRPEPPANPFES